MFSSFIHVVASFHFHFFLLSHAVPLYGSVIFDIAIHNLVDTCCFHILFYIMNDTGKDIHKQVFVWTCGLFVGAYVEVGFVGHLKTVQCFEELLQ